MTLQTDLEKAIARRQELSQELEKLDQLINLWTWWRDESESLGTGRSMDSPSAGPGGNSPSAGVEPNPESFGPFASPAEVIRETLLILSEHGRPLKRGQLLKELSDNGVRIKGSDKSKVLGTTLWRAKDKIIGIDGWGYWIKNRPCPLAGYKPDPLDELLG